MDGRKNNRGTIGNNGGSKGYGKGEIIKKYFDIGCPIFWKILIEKMKKGDPWALSEFNKIQVKMIPQTLAGDVDNPLIVKHKIAPEDKEKIDKAISNL
jgi:hypothetical protein